MISPIEKDLSFSSDFLNVVSFSERIASALFIVADFIPNDNPIGLSLRNLSLELIKRTFSIKDSMDVSGVALIARELMSFLSILEVSKMLNTKSSALLKGELEKFLSVLFSVSRIKVFENNSQYGIPEKLFENALSAPIKAPHKGHDVLDERIEVQKIVAPQLNRVEVATKNSTQQKTSLTSIVAKESHRPSLDERKVQVVEVLKSESNLTVKDFTKFIQGCSEKTIQRDLATLVALGKVKREGERRWARYSLI